MLLSSSDNRWKDKEVPSRLRGQLNECWLERLPEGTKKILCINDFQFLGTFTIGRAYLWISTICYLTLLIITVSRYKIVYNYRNYLVLKTSVKNNCVNEPFREIIQSYNKTGTKRKPGVHQYLTTRKHVSPMKWLDDRKCDRPWWRVIWLDFFWHYFMWYFPEMICYIGTSREDVVLGGTPQYFSMVSCFLYNTNGKFS